MSRVPLRATVLAFLLLPALAVGQQPIELSTGGGQPITLQMPGTPKGPVKYATESLASVRFLGEAVPGPTFAAGDALEVVVEEAGWARVKKGDQFGWVPAAKLGEQAPPPKPE